MRTQMAETEEEALAGMWATHRESVWRLLLALARNMDLADDLLQDTYLRAREGIGAYRNGDPRAWLAAIARKVYYSYARQRRVRSEVVSTHPERLEADPPSVDLVALLVVRQALAALPPTFRTALVMKHYAGYSYQEIARRQHCPVGTAKWRVSEALSRLRLALVQERRAAMADRAEGHEVGLVDYVYGVLPEEETGKVREHLAACGGCRREAEELGKVVRLLEAMEGDRRNMHLIELDRGGGMMLHAVGRSVNEKDHPVRVWEFQSDAGPARHMYQDGEEIPVRSAPDERFGDRNYVATLHHPVPPGGLVSLLAVLLIPSDHPLGVDRLGEDRFRLRWTQGPSSTLEYAYVQVVRLPAGAKLLSARPEPDEKRGDQALTLVWRTVLPPAAFFECTVEYQVDAL